MGQLANSHIASALGMSHSSVSRMRTGERVASYDVLEKIVQEYGGDPGEWLHAAAAASRGDVDSWVKMLSVAFSDGELEEAEVPEHV